MNIRRLRFLLWLGAAGFAAAAAGLVGWSVDHPPHVREALAKVLPHESASATTHGQLPSLASIERAITLDVRRPLFDPPPAPLAAAPPPPPAPPLAIKLAGTVIEPGHCRAMLFMPDGKMELKAVGDNAGGAEITTIDEEGITVLYSGKSVRLKIDKGKPG